MLFTPAAFALISGRAPARAAAVAAPARGDWPAKVRAISGSTQGSLISTMAWQAPRRVGSSGRATFSTGGASSCGAASSSRESLP